MRGWASSSSTVNRAVVADAKEKFGASKRRPVSHALCYCSWMTKKSTTTQTSTTHFEQIPLDVVKSIAREEISADGETGAIGVAVEKRLSGRRMLKPSTFMPCTVLQRPGCPLPIVDNFIGEGLEQGAAAVLFVTPDHAARIESCLRTRSIDVDALRRLGTLVTVDARATLDVLMMDGMPSPSAFRRTVGAMLTQVRREHGQCAIRAYGEMVDLLWKDGLEAAAIRLETLWNQLADTPDFNLLCGYSMGNYYKGAALDEIKAQHTHLVADDGRASVLVGPLSGRGHS